MNKGFSLIELLVVITIVGIVLSLGLASLAATIRSSTKTTIFNQVKQSGDLTMETIVRSVRNAIDVCTTGDRQQIIMYSNRVNCSPLPPSFLELTRYICVADENDPNPNPNLRNGKIEKRDMVSGVSSPLTAQVRVDTCNFSHSETTPRRITIDFTLRERVDLPQTPDYQVTIPFHSEVTLRNF